MLGHMNYDTSLSKRLLDMLEGTEEPIATVIGIHLLTEHGLNYPLSGTSSH